MDLKSIAVNNESVFLTLKDPFSENDLLTDKEELMQLEVLSPLSKEFLEIETKYNKKKRTTTQKLDKNGNFIIDLDAEQMKLEWKEKAMTCVVGFKNIQFGGEILVFSKENLKLILDSVPEFVAQINIFLGDRKNFTKAS